jgi:hypothetical protein
VVLDEKFLGKLMRIRNVIFEVFLATFKNVFGVMELHIRKTMLKVKF